MELPGGGVVVADTVIVGRQVYGLIPIDSSTMLANTQDGLAFIDTRSLNIKYLGIYDDNAAVCRGEIFYSSMGRLFHFKAGEKPREIVYDRVSGQRIHSLVCQEGSLWFSTQEGIFSYEPESQKVRKRSAAQGGFKAGYFDTGERAMIWGGNDCLLLFPPESGHGEAQKERQVHLTAITENGRELICGTDFMAEIQSQGDLHIRLFSRANIQMEFSCFDYGDGDMSQYCYNIDGSATWEKLPSGQNTLSLVALAGGKHTLKVSCGDPTAEASARITTIILAVPHPWYATWQAIAAYIVAAILLILLIIRYITRRNKQLYEQRERERVLELSSLKMDFFVNISHELKTPLSLIVAPVGRLMAEIKDGKAREQLAIVEKNALRLNTLIKKILDFKRLEYESEDTLMPARIDLVALLRGSMANFAANAAQRGIQMSLQSATDSMPMDVDVIKIESVMANLISNALRHVADHTGRVTVTLSQYAGRTEIIVADNGAGVQPRELPLLFERYFHGDDSGSGSSGIGLHLVKKFVELHGGTVAAANDGGLRITVTLPQNASSLKRYDDNQADSTTDNSSFNAQNSTFALRRDVVLIVDDNSEILDFISQSLADAYDCLTAQNGQEAWRIIQERRIDVAIVDQMMPLMDGMTLVKTIRAHVTTATLPVIMLTAKDDNLTEMESLRTGVDVFIAKPFDMHKLQLHIVRLLKNRSTIEQCRRITEMANPEYAATETAPSSDEALLARINEIIGREMSHQGFTVEALAEASNLTTKSLYRKVKQLTGVTPVRYIMRLRMKKARALLQGQGFTVTEVCYMVGLSNPSYFSKCFVSEFGISPKDFAAQAAEQQ